MRKIEAVRYLKEILEPTVRDYANNRTSRRHGFLACVVCYHMLDNIVGNKKISTLKKQVHQECPSFIVIERVAHAFKHVETGFPTSPVKPLREDEVISRPPAFYGQAAYGLSRYGDRYGGVTINDARNVDLLAELGIVQHYFQQMLAPEDYPLPVSQSEGDNNV